MDTLTVTPTDTWPQTCCDCGARVTADQSWTHHEVCS